MPKVTKRSQVRFAASESDLRPFVQIELLRRHAKLPGIIKFELKDGTDYEPAKTVATYLNSNILGLAQSG